MKMQQKLILSFLSIILLVALGGYLSVNASQNALQKSIGEDSVILAVEMLEQIDRSIYHRMVSVMELCRDSITQKAAILSNEEFEKLDDIPAFLEQKDNEWTAAPKNEITPFMQKLLNRDLSRILKQKQNFFEKEYGYQVFGEIFVTNQYGANVAQTNKTSDYYQADESWWQTAQKNGLYVSNVEYDRSAAVYSTDICLRINDQNGNFLGVVKAVLNINETIRIIKSAEKKHAVAGFALLTNDYKFIYATEKHKFLEPVPETFAFLPQYDPDHQLYCILEGDHPGDGGKLLSHTHSKGYKNYPGLDWILVIEYDTGKIFAPVTKLKINIFAITLFIIIVAVILTWFISQSISHPIQKLIHAVAEIGHGNLETRVKIESNNEMGQLGASFNKMVNDLKNTTTSIENLNREIHERKKLESQLVQAQKLESIGQLAAGVAHEINTPIQYIGDNLNFLKDGFQDILKLLDEYEQLRDHAAHQSVNPELLERLQNVIVEVDQDYLNTEITRALDEAREGVQVVSQIVSAMKEFAHSGNQEKTAVDLNQAIAGTATITRNQWKYAADLETDLDPELPLVTCHAGEINQVILNLIVNAAAAISEKMGENSDQKGTIAISTRHDGDYAEIRIADNGAGVPETIRNKIFDPFFTTKQVGQGSGQGLTLVHAIIVKKHDGSLTFESKTGRGTTFIIRLPLEPTESVTHDTASAVYEG